MIQIEDGLPYESWLLNFEEGISRLTPDNIMKLRGSNEFGEFRKQVSSLNDHGESYDDAIRSLIAYKTCIDNEILEHFPHLKEPRKVKREIVKPLEILSQLSSYGGVALSGLALVTDPFPGANELSLGISVISVLTSQFVKKMAEEEKAKTEREKIKAIDYLKHSHPAKIESNMSISTNDVIPREEVFFKSIV